MAVLPPIKRFVQDDFNGISTISAFTAKLFYPLNLFLNAVYSALNNGLTLSQNTIGAVKTATSITANSSGIATTTVNWPFPQSPPTGVAVLNCLTGTTQQTYPLISWAYSSGVVTLSMQFVMVTAGAVVVAPSGTYNVTFWISGG